MFDDEALETLWSSLPPRLHAKIHRHPYGGCWEWTAARGKRGKPDETGYGRTLWDGRKQLVHRLMYTLFYGSPPDGLPLGHYLHPDDGCIGPPCCNPMHVKLVTHRENILRGTSRSATNAVKTHCPEGHEYTPENTYVRKRPNGNTQRECRACVKVRNLEGSRQHMERNVAKGLTTQGKVPQLKLNPETDRRFKANRGRGKWKNP